MAAAKSTSSGGVRGPHQLDGRSDTYSDTNQRGQEEDFQSTISCIPCGAAWEKIFHRAELGENDAIVSGDLPYA